MDPHSSITNVADPVHRTPAGRVDPLPRPRGNLRDRRMLAVAGAWYDFGRYGTAVPEQYQHHNLSAEELVIAGAFEQQGADEAGVAKAMPGLPLTRLERALQQARVEAARRHRWQTVRTVATLLVVLGALIVAALWV